MFDFGAQLLASNLRLIVSHFDASGTTYYQDLSNGGPLIDLTVSRVVTGSNGATLYANTDQEGWVNGAVGGAVGGAQVICSHKANSAFLAEQVQGLTHVTLVTVLSTNDGSCNISKTDTYLVGCMNDNNPNYSDTYDIHDGTQCAP